MIVLTESEHLHTCAGTSVALARLANPGSGPCRCESASTLLERGPLALPAAGGLAR